MRYKSIYVFNEFHPLPYSMFFGNCFYFEFLNFGESDFL